MTLPPSEAEPHLPPATATAELSARTATVTAVLQIAARGLSLAAAVAATGIITRTVGVATYADWATSLTVIAMLGFVLDPGIGPIVVRRLIQTPETAPTVRAMLLVRLALALVAVLVAVAIVTALRGTDATLVAAVLAAQLLPRTVILNAATLLQVDHLQHRQAFLDVASALVGLAAIAVAAAADLPVAVLALVGVTVPLLLQVVPVSRWAARTRAARRIVAGDDRERLRSIAREIAPLALALLLVAIYTRVQVVFVNAAEDADAVARYLLAFQVVEQTLIVAGIVAATLLPFIADRARDNADVHGDALTQSVLLTAATVGAITAGGLIVVARVVTSVLGGADLADASTDLVLLTPLSAAIFPAMLLSYTYATMGQSRRYLLFNAVGLAVALAGNAVFTLAYGTHAAARVSYGVEFVVVAIALVAVARSGPGGRALTVRLALLAAAAVAAAESAAAGVPAALAGTLLVLAGLLVGGRASWQLVRARLAGAQ